MRTFPLQALLALLLSCSAVAQELPPPDPLKPPSGAGRFDANRYAWQAYEILRKRTQWTIGTAGTAVTPTMLNIHVARSGIVERVEPVSSQATPEMRRALDDIFKGAMLPPLPADAPAPHVLQLPLVVSSQPAR